MPAATSCSIRVRTCDTAAATPSGSNGRPAAGSAGGQVARGRAAGWTAGCLLRAGLGWALAWPPSMQRSGAASSTGVIPGDRQRPSPPFIMFSRPVWSRWVMSNHLRSNEREGRGGVGACSAVAARPGTPRQASTLTYMHYMHACRLACVPPATHTQPHTPHEGPPVHHPRVHP